MREQRGHIAQQLVRIFPWISAILVVAHPRLHVMGDDGKRRGFADQVVGRPGKARVQTARGQPAVALQFLHQLKQTQAQVGFVEIVFTESRETRHFFDDLRFFCLADRIALHEGIRVFPRANLRASSRKVFKFSGRSFSVLWNQAVAA